MEGGGRCACLLQQGPGVAQGLATQFSRFLNRLVSPAISFLSSSLLSSLRPIVIDSCEGSSHWSVEGSGVVVSEPEEYAVLHSASAGHIVVALGGAIRPWHIGFLYSRSQCVISTIRGCNISAWKQVTFGMVVAEAALEWRFDMSPRFNEHRRRSPVKGSHLLQITLARAVNTTEAGILGQPPSLTDKKASGMDQFEVHRLDSECIRGRTVC
ncbi:uncharacterized protein DSM5745_06933 [Aspergillus mulundensis]|uniref:Uncharacterized protein n=1 Tax=Aspergillus mulundensis TaxID=1810919 RepID=A0A3D8RKB6_9EURO|nr:hypothetical protein DSM5745_06933 [Aspergillus mulundensis]RDW74271.1 hypothetical protein DSM5745_06933 [Aspergillus mulundensis]